jgi:hypothetical protein
MGSSGGDVDDDDDDDGVLIMLKFALCWLRSCGVKYEEFPAAQASCGAVSCACCSIFICAYEVSDCLAAARLLRGVRGLQ